MPNGWAVIPLGELLNQKVKNGYSPVCPTEPTGKWMLSLGAVGPSGINSNEIKPAPPKDSKLEGYQLRSGDFLISRSNTRERVGFSALFRGEIENCYYPDLLMRFRVDEAKLLPEYLENYLYSKAALSYLQGAASGTSGSMVKITKGVVEALPVPLPPIKEQEKIAKILSTWSQAIEKIGNQIKRMELKFEWFLSDLLSPQKSTNENRVWRTYKLSDLAQFINGRGFKQSEWTSSGLPIIRIQNLNGSSEFNYYNGDFDKRHYINTNDLLFSWSGNRGTSFGPNIWGGAPGLLNQHIFKVENTDLISKEFLYLVLKYATKIIERKAHGGSGLVHVTKSELEKFEVDLPGNANDFSVMSNLLLSKEFELKLLKRKIILFQCQKQGLMQQLLTGKKRVKV